MIKALAPYILIHNSKEFMNNILIIGGSGCVGQETTSWLKKNSPESKVICLSRGQTSFQKDKSVTYEIGDILNMESILAVLKKHEVTHVLHTAALRTSDCKSNPALAVKININGTTNVLEAIRLYGKIKRLVFTSTAAIYEVPKDDKLAHENDRTIPLNAYTATKIACEQMIECYSRNYSIPSTILRPQVIYGPGRGSEGSTAGVTIAIKEAFKGTQYEIPFSGKMCFVYSDDAGKYHGKALLASPHFCEVYNLPGFAYDIAEISSAINKKLGSELVTYKAVTYPFPKGLDDQKFLNDFPNCEATHLNEVLDAWPR